MKILIVSTYESKGGAAKAAYRLHTSLMAEGIDSRMLVQIKDGCGIQVLGPERKIEKIFMNFRRYIDRLPLKFYRNRKKMIFFPAWLPFGGIVNRINAINPDIVHLQWISAGMLRIEDLLKIKKPIVWSMHDDWAFTGGCHLKFDCQKFMTGCGFCPVLRSKARHDLSYKVFQKKKKTYGGLKNLTIIGLSRWISECAENSLLFKDYPVLTLPNPIDTDLFRPMDKQMATDRLGLSADKQYILFGGVSADSDINKGYQNLINAFRNLQVFNVELIVIGDSKPDVEPGLNFPVHYLGFIKDEKVMRDVYNASDVVIVPSYQETLSNIIMESLACGTPVVAFDAGGNSDMIDHLSNGYLAKRHDSLDLACGIKWVLDNNDYSGLSKNAREKIMRDFDSRVVVKKYIQLYDSILNG